MSYGLKIMNGSTVVVDTSSVVARLLGKATVTAGSGGSVTNTAFSTGTPFYIWMPQGVLGLASTLPNFTWSGNTMSWTSGNISGEVFYGVRS